MEQHHRHKEQIRADYTYTVEGSVIAIIDLDQGSKSVTNDIENVLNDFGARLAIWPGMRSSTAIAWAVGMVSA